MGSTPEDDSLHALRAENARLIGLLEAHGIPWRIGESIAAAPPESAGGAPLPTAAPTELSKLSTDEKVALFGRLFLGRRDVYPMRWESRSTGKSGYAPACANEWRPGVCEKPRVKCADCGHRQLIPMSDEAIYKHLAGQQTLGVYPLLVDDCCNFLAVDFDEADWKEDGLAFVGSCNELGVPVALEVSRSGAGAHAWIFFRSSLPARDARRLGTAIISHTCARTRQLKLSSYDRLFPNQDTMPKGGFGNLIALPLQKKPRESGHSVFVDSELRPYPDQWAFLASVRRMPMADIEPTVLRAIGSRNPLDVTFVEEEDLNEPWKRSSTTTKLSGTLPDSLTVILSNLVYFEKAALSQVLANRLIRLAAFQNPEFYKAQAMRLPVWDKPRVIGCAENFPNHIALPRGCLQPALALLQENGIRSLMRDERQSGAPLAVTFKGSLRPDQDAAAKAMLAHDHGVFCAPTAFGKTVVAAAVIAQRGVNTLVLVHRAELLRQWQERLQAFLGIGSDVVGTVGGGKSRATGLIDIAVMQSLSRKGTVDPIVERYGQVVVDECHHVGAVSFDAILKAAKAKYVLGLTATPVRRDGQQPIIFMQCGPTRHVAAAAQGSPHDLEVRPQYLRVRIEAAADAAIQEVFRQLANDSSRTAAIAACTRAAVDEGRKVLVLTERTEHLDALKAALPVDPPAVVLHGRMSKKQRATMIAALDALPPDAPRVLLSTGKLVGEGFDHPPLDTLILAMPISWKGTLQQYAGRLHREHVGKTAVRVIDFVDTGHPALQRMWERRQQGYRAMGYRIATERSPSDDQGQMRLAC